MRPQGATEPEPYAHDAKEYLRKLCIGADVDVSLEYSRKVVPTNAELPLEPLTLQMGNIVVPTARGLQQLAELIVRRGFAVVQVGRCAPC